MWFLKDCTLKVVINMDKTGCSLSLADVIASWVATHSKAFKPGSNARGESQGKAEVVRPIKASRHVIIARLPRAQRITKRIQRPDPPTDRRKTPAQRTDATTSSANSLKQQLIQQHHRKSQYSVDDHPKWACGIPLNAESIKEIAWR